MERTEQLSPLQKAAYALKEMRAKLDALERAQNEPIAIIGMACRFPTNANHPEAFWELLREGRDAVIEVPPERWDSLAYYDPNPNVPGKINMRTGGFLTNIDQFDAHFFGISPREATKLDPQHRLLLEVSWEALENAGQSPAQLVGKPTGMFLGITFGNYGYWQVGGNPEKLDTYTITGNGFSFACGRLSYFLGIQGPSLAVDTACSSSLVALHLACQSLRTQECNMAIVGGAQLTLSPEFHVSLAKSQSFSPSGHCKTFDASADGFVLGEGCGVLILKRLSEAQAQRDHIHGLILSAGVNHDGQSSGLTVPNEQAQENLIRQVITRAKVNPEEVSYVETHGTGTSLGDPIEIGALASVFGKRPADQPLILGAVKTNIGHLNAAAGMAGVIKTVLAMQHEEIPPNLHFKTPNPHISWDRLPTKIPLEVLPWPRNKQRRLAGVSSFGLGGTNAHVLLAEAPLPVPVEKSVERPQNLFTLSAKSESALRELAKSYQTYLQSPTKAELADICFTANAGRSHFNYRFAAVVDSDEQLQHQLTALVETKEVTKDLTVFLNLSGLTNRKPLKTAFVFSGNGYPGMGQQLYETQPSFRQTVERCQELLRPAMDNSLTRSTELIPHSRLSTELIPHSRLNFWSATEELSPVATFVIEYALAELWQAWGIKPTAVFGHGVGEYVAACVAGIITLEQGLQGVTQGLPLPANRSSAKLLFVSSSQPLTTLLEKGYNCFLELGSSAVSPVQEVLWLSGLTKETSDWQGLLKSLASLYVQGANIDWLAFDKNYSRQRVPLPTYPFQRQRYWISKEELQVGEPKTSLEIPAISTSEATPTPLEVKSEPVAPAATSTPPTIPKLDTSPVFLNLQGLGKLNSPVTPPLARLMSQQLQAASEAVSQVVSQQLAFLQKRGGVTLSKPQPLLDIPPQNDIPKTTVSPTPPAEPKEVITPVETPLISSEKDAITKNTIVPEEKTAEASPPLSTIHYPLSASKLLLLSASSAPELEIVTTQLIEQLQQPAVDLADVARQLRERQVFPQRRALVCQNTEEAIQSLQTLDPKRVMTTICDSRHRPIRFMFPGVGDHYVNLAKGLYQTDAYFQQQVDECCDILLPLLGQDLRNILYPNTAEPAESGKTPRFDFKKMFNRGPADEATQTLNRTIFSQPAVFMIEYALAKLWMHWGIQPQAMIGYSIGEYVAACLSGVMNLQDSLLLVTQRAKLIQEMPAGTMLAVPWPETKILPLLGEELSIAIISTPSQCVVGGPPSAIAQLEQQLQQQEVLCRRIQTTQAFHSKMLVSLREPLTQVISQFVLQPPQIPYLSNVTGTWITESQAMDPHYWAQHTYQTVRFADGVTELLQTPNQILLEVGPGQSLGSFVLQHPAFAQSEGSVVLPSLRSMYDKQADEAFLLTVLGKLWLNGVNIEMFES